jgi:hypothetical protein
MFGGSRKFTAPEYIQFYIPDPLAWHPVVLVTSHYASDVEGHIINVPSG